MKKKSTSKKEIYEALKNHHDKLIQLQKDIDEINVEIQRLIEIQYRTHEVIGKIVALQR